MRGIKTFRAGMIVAMHDLERCHPLAVIEVLSDPTSLTWRYVPFSFIMAISLGSKLLLPGCAIISRFVAAFGVQLRN